MTPPTARLEIEYCTGCRWQARAAWMAQELLTTFPDLLGEVALRPSREGGVFALRLDGELLFDRHAQGRFPEPKEIKQMVRDRLAPERGLGHSDGRSAGQRETESEESEREEG